MFFRTMKEKYTNLRVLSLYAVECFASNTPHVYFAVCSKTAECVQSKNTTEENFELKQANVN